MPSNRSLIVSLRRLPLVSVLLVALSGSLGCTVNPATGERQFNALSESREVTLGEDAEPKFLKKYGGPIPAASPRQRVEELGRKLASVSERPDLPWNFHAVDSAQVNAFALPGGKIFITRGMLEALENEAQLAGVLAHEIGHVTAQHIGQQMSRTTAINLGLVTLGAVSQASDERLLEVLGAGAQIGSGLYLLNFSRSQEHQADALGLRYMTERGYNPVGQVQVMQILQEASQARGIEFLSTHPNPGSRIDRLESLIQQRYPNYGDPEQYRFGRDEYQQQVLKPLRDLPPPEHQPAES